MKRNLTLQLALVVLTCGWHEPSVSMARETVFHYRVFQGDGSKLPIISDAGEGKRDGTADATTKLSSMVPSVGVPSAAGNRAIDGRGQGGVNSAGTMELSNTRVADEGGFTMETWFLWNGGGAVNPLIDYAGTEKLVIDTREGTGNELRMRINSESSQDTIIGNVEANRWYYTAAVFDTLGNSVIDGSITGQFGLYLDGQLVKTSDPLTITDFGDSLNRAIGVSKHPLNFELDRFDGLVFEPRVTLGALPRSDLLFVPEPSSLALSALALLGLSRWRRAS